MYKICLLILKTYEDLLLKMSFEMMLAQMMALPVKFLIADCQQLEKDFFAAGGTDQAELAKLQVDAIHQFDQQLKAISIPSIMLDRLKKEFDDSHSLSTQFGKEKKDEKGRTSSMN